MDKKNSILLIETFLIYILLSYLAYFSASVGGYLRYLIFIPTLLFQGLWFYRLYIIGHEASHGKLFTNKQINFIFGSIVLIPLLVPIPIYRKIHAFHHGFNRKDYHTSSLDTYVVKGKANIFQKIYYYTIWYIAVFFGGLFLHSLVSVLLFLFVPVSLSEKVSPAFKGWNFKKQLYSIFLFSVGVLVHLAVYFLLGKKIYLYSLLYPMLSFAWVLSLVVYIFHYRATTGKEVLYNVRSLKAPKFLMWILLNFTEHATHHQSPQISWYDLEKKKVELPEEFAKKNHHYQSIFKAILNQIKGPIIHEE